MSGRENTTKKKSSAKGAGAGNNNNATSENENQSVESVAAHSSKEYSTPKDSSRMISVRPIAVATSRSQNPRTQTLRGYTSTLRSRSNASNVLKSPLQKTKRALSPNNSVGPPAEAASNEYPPAEVPSNTRNYLPTNILQFPLSDAVLEERLNMVRGFSKNQIQIDNFILKNCANLTLVLLGLVKNPQQYLQICTRRNKATFFSEIERTIKNTNATCQLSLEKQKVLPQEPYYAVLQKYIKPYLRAGFATIVHFKFDDTHHHSLLVRKSENGIFELIDAQERASNGSYPYRQSFTLSAHYTYKPNQNIIEIHYYSGPTYETITNPSAIAECLEQTEEFPENVPEQIRILYSRPNKTKKNSNKNNNKNKNKNKKSNNPNNNSKRNNTKNTTTRNERP
jgi:hypothetical protein